MAWLTVMLKGLKLIHEDFLTFREDANLQASFTGQVMVLERMMNLHYFQEDIWASPVDPTASGHIWIDLLNSSYNPPIWFLSEGQLQNRVIWFLSENQPGPLPIYYQNENQQVVSFKVMVPVGLTFNEPEMRARLGGYVEAGYDYEIETY